MLKATSVFIGGGTPTLVPADELMSVLAEIPLASGAEVTVECNPDNVTADLLRTYLDAGVNRISLGVQSMVPHVLAALGREHDPDNVRYAVEACRAVGIDNFNLDLIYGAHGESIDDWVTTVASVLALEPPHVSAYALTVEPGTPLADDAPRHPDDDDQADKYPIVDEMLEDAGLANYEISNWAQEGHECRHNAVYWSGGDYAGFGSAAHAHRAGRRSWNVRTPDRFVELIEAGRSAESSHEVLDDATRILERLQLQLRTRDGVPTSALAANDVDEMAELVQQVADPARGERLVLTRAGRLLANEVSLRLRG